MKTKKQILETVEARSVKLIGALQSWGSSIGENSRPGWQWFGEEWFASGFVYPGITMVFDDSIPLPQKYIFTRDLTLGSQGIDVRFLQNFLNTHNCPIVSSGPGSLGNETSFFGELTREALAKFQKDNGISPALGYFGPLTRKVANI